MALNLTDALNQYGFVGDLANSIPELKGIFAQAAREEWDPARFQRAVMDSGWWKANAETARNLATQAVADPGTYKQTIKNAGIKVDLLIKSMGLTPQTPSRLDALAKHMLVMNYDDETIRRWLAANIPSRVGEQGALSGQAAELEGHMRQVAQSYGVGYTDRFLRQEVTKIQMGDATLDGFEALMRERAKAAFPQFQGQLDGGMTLRDIADPYISTMANTLEVSETEIDLLDPWVKRALSTKSPEGTQDAMPLWQFERALKDDARWDKTKQARTEAFDTIAQVGRDFGFVGSAS